MPGNADLQRRLESIEDLLHRIEASADPNLRASVQELVELVMGLHGAGMERMLEILRSTGEPGDTAIARIGRDELSGSLLILHGIHPVAFEDRARQALDQVSSRLRHQGAELEVISIEEGAVRLRLLPKANSCASTARSLKDMVAEALDRAAPDLTSLIIDDHEQKPGFVALETLLNGAAV